MADKRDLNFEAADVLRKFHTFVWKADLKPVVHQSIDVNIVGKLDQIRRSEPKLAPGQAWQSEQTLHKLDEFHDLVSCINEAIESGKPRISISFNIMFSSYAEKLSKPLW